MLCGSLQRPLFLGSLSSICSAHVGDLFVFEGRTTPKKQKTLIPKENSRSSSCQASGCVTADSDDLFVQGSGEQGAFSSLLVRVRGRLLDGWTSLTVPRSKREQHLQVLLVSGQEMRMRSGWTSPGDQKINFPEENWREYEGGTV